MTGSKVRLWLGIALASFHLGISIVIVIYGGSQLGKFLDNSFDRQICFLLLTTLTLAQSSLLGTWAMLGKGAYWVRLPLSFWLLLWSGYSFLCLEYWNNSEFYVSILIMMCVQYFGVAGLIFFIQIILKLLKMDSHLDSSTKFSMGTLMIAVTLIAVSIGIGKLVIQQLGLTMDIFTEPNDSMRIYPFFAIFNALTVVLMLPALWLHNLRMKIYLLIPLLIMAGIISVIEGQLFAYFINNRLPWYYFVVLNLGQAFFFYITVFPLWRWKTNSEEKSPVIESDTLALDGIKE